MKTLRRISKNRAFTHARILAAVFLVVAAAALIFMSVSPPAAAQSTPRTQSLTPTFSKAVAFDVSPALRTLPLAKKFVADPSKLLEIRPERGPRARSRGYKSGDAALQALTAAVAIPSPLANFEGLSNQDNLNIFGFRVNPPDPNGEIGPNNYVEVIQLPPTTATRSRPRRMESSTFQIIPSTGSEEIPTFLPRANSHQLSSTALAYTRSSETKCSKEIQTPALLSSFWMGTPLVCCPWSAMACFRRTSTAGQSQQMILPRRSSVRRTMMPITAQRSMLSISGNSA